MQTLAVVLAAVVAATWYLTWTAARLDRLHARIEGARAALDAQLLRRASVAQELAISALLDPATSVLLAAAAHEARACGEEDREVAESDLTKALRAAFDDPEAVAAVSADPYGGELLAELGAAARRVQLARRFHNDAVRAARAVRRQRVVRYLRLAGRAPLPDSFEIEDSPPAFVGH
ncbi:MAG: hypothetical protein ACRDYU_15230 [Actinomycetes bacterium]